MGVAAKPFGDRLAEAVAARQSQIVLGIDPDPAALWPAAQSGTELRALGVAASAATAVLHHCRALIDAAGPACVAVKPQLACFERLGAAGVEALAATVAHAREAGLLVIADGKRGDIDVSVRAYAEAQFGGSQTPFGHVPGLGADAATLNPLMGADTLATVLAVVRASGGGVFVLVRTSNPGAADVLDLQLADSPDRVQRGEASADGAGAPGAVWERLALLVAELGELGSSGLADVGAVVGATRPEHLARARELMPNAPFLLPGIGAQGGRVEDLEPVFANRRDAGLISASRSIANAHRAAGGEPPHAARAEAERLRELAWTLSSPAGTA